MTVQEAWSNVKPRFGMLLFMTLIVIVVANIWLLGQFVLNGPIAVVVQSIGFTLVFVLVGPCIAGLTRAHALASEGKPVRMSDFGYGFQSAFHFAHSILLWLMLTVILLLSSLALIIPAFLLGAKLQYAFPAFATRRCTATEAIALGWGNSDGYFGRSAALLLLYLLLLIAGAAALGVGVLVVAVLVPQMAMIQWREMD